MNYRKKIIGSLLVLFSFSGCKSIPSYSTDYEHKRTEIVGTTLNDDTAQAVGKRFTSTFNTLGTPVFLKQVDTLYANEIFVNDTLSQFSNKNSLMQHFEGMNKRVSNVTVKLINTTYHQDSAYVHWFMAYDFKIFGKNKSMASYGISEIKINSANQIVFQQDFWDPANGLYRRLPYAGGAYSWLMPFKKSQ